ncbi:MAG: DUF3540 domain-containing protein [Myxococcota bacterium]
MSLPSPLSETPVPAVRRGVVRSIQGAALRIRAGDATMDALIALPNYRAQRGDEVLFLSSEETNYVIGVTRRLRHATPELEVHDEGHVLHVPEGNLSIEVGAGRLRLSARDGVEIGSKERVSVTGSRVAIGGSEELLLSGGRLTTVADQPEVLGRRAAVTLRELESDTEHARLRFGVVEAHAERVVERLGTVYREVRDLAQLRAGQLRFVAKGAASMLGRRTRIEAEEDVKIDGETIRLA